MNNNLVMMSENSPRQTNILVEEWFAESHNQRYKEAYEKGYKEGGKTTARKFIVQLLELKFSQKLDVQGAADELDTIRSKSSELSPNPINEIIRCLEYVDSESWLTELFRLAWYVPDLATFLHYLPLDEPRESPLCSLREVYKIHDQLHPLSIEEYHRLIEINFFQPDKRFELIDGFLLTNSPVNPRQRACRHRLMKLLQGQLGQRVQVLMQSPVTLSNSNSEPEPDIVVVQSRGDEYVARHPEANDIFLVAEVSRSTLEFDRDMKYQLYAREDIAEYWILNLVDDLLEVYQVPYVENTGVAGYRMEQTFGRDERVSPLAFPRCQILVDEMFP